MAIVPSGSGSVMASRATSMDALDFFPTPPWATRALCEHVLPVTKGSTAWEPAAGEGHMAHVLKEYFANVHASDVHDYGAGFDIGSFVGIGADHAECPFRPDWIITNPPFSLALEFAERSIDEAACGVALLVRSVWAESATRFERLFSVRPPWAIAQFVERVPMVKGRWDPSASTATGYAWFIWKNDAPQSETLFKWIPPGCRKSLTRTSDIERFSVQKLEA